MHFGKTGNETSKAGAGSLQMALICSVMFGSICLTLFPLGIAAARKLALLNDPVSQPSTSSSNNQESDSPGVHSTPLWETPISTSTLLGGLSLLVVVTAGTLTTVALGRRVKRRGLESPRVDMQPDATRSKALRKVLAKRNAIFGKLDAEFDQMIAGRSIVVTYMSSELVTIRPNTSVQDALQMLQEQGFRRFLVTHPDGTLSGVVSKKDLTHKTGRTVADVMTNKPRIARPNTELYTALSSMLEGRISCLPVVDKEDKLIGLLSSSDLLMVLQCLLLDLKEKNTQFAASTS
ncbi:MAG: CBS domain-containing protein [Planctomycetota bacterium]